MFNIYSCSIEDLLSIKNVGAVSAGKIIELRDRVLLESSPLITTKDLAEIRLDVETWDNLIKDGVLSLERIATKHKITPLDVDIGATGEILSSDKKTGTIMSPTSEPTKLSVSPELRVYLEMISTCQIETKEAIKALAEENHKINKEKAELWTGYKSLCSNHDSVLCTIDAKMNSTESKLLAKSQDFHDKITTDIKSLNEDTYSSVADMRVNLQALMKRWIVISPILQPI